MDSSEVVAEYMSAFWSGAAERAASLVTEDFSLETPIQTFEGPKDLQLVIAHIASVTRSSRILRQWVDSEDVCSLYMLGLEPPTGSVSLTVSQWDSIRAGKISSSLMVFDTGAFPGTQGVSGAVVDPVCHMNVDTASPAAQRHYDEQDFLFCSTGCADLFDAHPERYSAGRGTS